jgi:5'-deoxynucleotidase YfbR-like HD superfamily hydrolase
MKMMRVQKVTANTDNLNLRHDIKERLDEIDQAILFPERLQELDSIKRFDSPDFLIMFYRPTLKNHAMNVASIVKSILPYACNAIENLDPARAYATAHVHDDHEISFYNNGSGSMQRLGDVQLNAKMKMNVKEKNILRERERQAIEFLCSLPHSPKTLNGFSYKGLLYDAYAEGKYKSAEAQLVKLADRIDCLGECIHEMISGNFRFFEGPFNKCIQDLESFSEQYPQIAPLWKYRADHPVFSIPRKLTESDIIFPQTEATVNASSGIPVYDFWKEISVRNWGIKYLVEKREGKSLKFII